MNYQPAVSRLPSPRSPSVGAGIGSRLYLFRCGARLVQAFSEEVLE